ncbi:hypothetical protein AWM75_08245 [Aerococcus urinaehominis]|uniref:Uncharacterized protein n=1 Tax=Aerococcus urinaehominis TaxID=128944 RepID=A0A0X8FME8_9LACT|nr:Spx/MgsR family RNA polymerase-binding regulatory protein [Aerococcus urinaehominis]AMB99960.1 hypothetical protein AWM75_08245 [Aerococcus urinaehominis]SDM44649.1 arsenate reductase [Aerococcus urinaehominis]
MLSFYGLKNCSTCKKVLKHFEAVGLAVETIDIREHPPASDLIDLALDRYGNPRKVINTSGQAYRQSGLKDQLAGMTNQEISQLLAADGMLVKRPFITDGQTASAGAKLDELDQVWLDQE